MNFMNSLYMNTGRMLQAASKKKPEILMGLGIICSIGAVISAAKESPVAVQRLAEKREEKGEELTTVEKVKTALPYYAPAIGLEALSILCTVGSGKAYGARYSDLLATYAITDGMLKDYRKEVQEKLSTKQEADIRQAFAEDRIKEAESDTKQLVEDLRTGTQRFCDPFGRLFITDINVIKNAVNNTNARMQREDWVRLNEFYYEIGLSSANGGDALGWNFERDGFIDPTYVPVFDDDTGVTTIYIDFGNNPPNMDYDRWEL